MCIRDRAAVLVLNISNVATRRDSPLYVAMIKVERNNTRVPVYAATE